MLGGKFSVALVAAAMVALALCPALHYPPLAFAAYAFFSRICHQDPARSFWIAGAPVSVCARCLGIYAGATLGALLWIDRRTAISGLAVGLLVNVVDVVTESAGLHRSIMLVRFVLGLALGAAITAVLTAREREDLTDSIPQA